MHIQVRTEQAADYKAVETLIQQAFEQEVYSDHREHLLVARLRETDAFIPELSLVATTNEGLILGYILLTKIRITDGGNVHDALALAPVAVLPAYQGKGIGTLLINHAHEQARKLGHRAVILLGHAAYYPRFGYRQADHYGIKLPFEAPKENCMALALTAQALDDITGIVVYPPVFFE